MSEQGLPQICGGCQTAYTPFPVKKRTEDGSAHGFVGRVRTEVSFNRVNKVVTFYLVPTVNRSLSLVVFLIAFGCFAETDCLSTNGISLFDEGEAEEDRQMHQLSPERLFRLEEVIKQFPCFTTRGLGKTTLEVHTIDTVRARPVKDRHYPVSPAVQKLLYGELDTMLARY